MKTKVSKKKDKTKEVSKSYTIAPEDIGPSCSSEDWPLLLKVSVPNPSEL